MGAVYLAEDERLVGRRCAIKENRPNANDSQELQNRMREQFLAEASVLARLDHANLPKVSDYFIENDREYLVMDYVEGEDLNSMLQRAQDPLPEADVLNWADQVLDALGYLHNQRPLPIIHRDIKPANIRINLHGKVKLVDFGLVKLFDASKPETKVELRGLGTPAYAPLEQFAGSDDHTDARSDIYALGATLYHLLTGIYPPDVHQRVLKPELLPPPRQVVPQLSAGTEQAILKAMAVHPSERHQTADEMRQALGGGSPSTARAGATGRGVSPWLFAVLGFVLVLVILGGVWWLLFGRSGQPEISAAASPPATAAVAVEPTPTEQVLQALGDAPTNTPTKVVEDTPTLEADSGGETSPIATPTFTPTAETTSTPPPVSQFQAIPRSSLVGTIAYPVYNGTNFDIYFGQADGSGSRLFRNQASQPAFSPDGSRIAFHSWRLDAWGLMHTDLSGNDEKLVARFVEDQLPTWGARGSEIIFLSRREGDRKSRLLKVGSNETGSDGLVLGEGEYPTVGLNGLLTFKAWGQTGSGLRLGTTNFTDIQPVTDLNEDTAPALSPDGRRILFMSRRDGNWEIYIANADGSELLRLTDDPADDGLPTWSPDGRAVAFVSNRGGEWGIWAMLPNGRGQQELFAMEGSPDGFVGSDRDASRGWAEERISWTK
jgi:serine/threonine-protein kinase